MTTFAPITPTITVPPVQVAADTYVIQRVQEALGQPLFVHISSMVIRGEEPVIVDTGTPANRTQWLEDVFALVEPEHVPRPPTAGLRLADDARPVRPDDRHPPPLPDQSVLDQIHRRHCAAEQLR